jgi:hypothetical protein
VAAWLKESSIRIQSILQQIPGLLKDPLGTWKEIPDQDEWDTLRNMAVFAVPIAVARWLCWGYWHFWTAFYQSLLYYILLVLLMFGTGKLIGIAALYLDIEIKNSRALQLSFYGFLPMLLTGILYANPMLGVLVPIGGLWGFYLIYQGLKSMDGLPAKKTALLILVTVLVMLIGVSLIGHWTGGVILPKMP